MWQPINNPAAQESWHDGRFTLQQAPRELRDEICQLTLYVRKGIIISTQDGKPQLQSPTPAHHVLALTTTCKEIRMESLSVFWSIKTIFRFTIDFEATFGDGHCVEDVAGCHLADSVFLHPRD